MLHHVDRAYAVQAHASRTSAWPEEVADLTGIDRFRCPACLNKEAHVHRDDGTTADLCPDCRGEYAGKGVYRFCAPCNYVAERLPSGQWYRHCKWNSPEATAERIRLDADMGRELAAQQRAREAALDEGAVLRTVKDFERYRKEHAYREAEALRQLHKAQEAREVEAAAAAKYRRTFTMKGTVKLAHIRKLRKQCRGPHGSVRGCNFRDLDIMIEPDRQHTGIPFWGVIGPRHPWNHRAAPDKSYCEVGLAQEGTRGKK